MFEFSIYQNTSRVARLEAPTFKEAFKRARAYVRFMAHVDGREDNEQTYTTPGRIGYQRGIYSATNTLRFDNATR